MNITKEITEFARDLHVAAPHAYAAFVAAFARYTQQQTTTLVNTGQNVTLAQGHAQQCWKILKALEDAKKNG